MVTTRPRTIHRLGRPPGVRSPDRIVVLDTETTPVPEADGERHRLRLWAAVLVRRHDVEPGRPRIEEADGRDADALADWLSTLAARPPTVWVFAHNLSFDLAVTALPVKLLERGWRVTETALTSESPWARFRRDDGRLVLADSWSWLPTSVETLGRLVGEPKVPLPAWGDDDDAWLRRCRSDVSITATALLEVLDWWDAEAGAAWSVTGPASGWATYRARQAGRGVLVRPDEAAMTAEAAAVTGGRREVRRLGLAPADLVADVDLVTAHLTAMARCPLPRQRIAHFEAIPPDHPFVGGTAADVLARAEVEVDRPRYPLETAAGVVYPVGRFATWLAGPELREARNRGELRSIGEGWVYVLGPHMAEWARWVASLLDERTDVPAPVRLVAKHWSRCVPGKWASRTGSTVARWPDPRPGWLVERAALMPEGRAADLLVLGGERWTIVRDEWADHAFPAVLAWIQSHTRVALGRLLDRLDGAWLSCNTDGVLVDVDRALERWGRDLPRKRSTETLRLRALHDLLEGWSADIAPFVARIKAAARNVTVLSPQHALIDGERRLSGIPRRAVDLGNGRFEFVSWPTLRVQLQRPEPEGFTTRRVVVEIGAIPPLGWRWLGGLVTPWRVDLDAEGRTILRPPDVDPALLGELAPPEEQHPLARRVLAGETVVLEDRSRR